MLKEISARLREELDYELEARHTALYGSIFAREQVQHTGAAGCCPSCRPSAC